MLCNQFLHWSQVVSQNLHLVVDPGKGLEAWAPSFTPVKTSEKKVATYNKKLAFSQAVYFYEGGMGSKSPTEDHKNFPPAHSLL